MTDVFEENFFEDEGDLLEVIEENRNETEEPQDTENQGNASQDEEEKKTIVKPKKRITRPQIKLDATRLVGPRGISVLESTFKDVKLKGKGHELEDLNKVLRTLEHWALRLFPKMSFEDCINKIEDLGLKRNVMVHVTKLRLGMEEPEIPIASDTVMMDDEVIDPFDQLVADNQRQPQPPSLTEEQRARMMRNRLIAEEIRMKKMQARQKQLAEEAENSSVTNESNSHIPTEIPEGADERTVTNETISQIPTETPEEAVTETVTDETISQIPTEVPEEADMGTVTDETISQILTEVPEEADMETVTNETISQIPTEVPEEAVMKTATNESNSQIPTEVPQEGDNSAVTNEINSETPSEVPEEVEL